MEVLSPSPDENALDVDTAVQALLESRERVFKKAARIQQSRERLSVQVGQANFVAGLPD